MTMSALRLIDPLHSLLLNQEGNSQTDKLHGMVTVRAMDVSDNLSSLPQDFTISACR
jgi:hypothetical protein